jgi:hypothetical protein
VPEAVAELDEDHFGHVVAFAEVGDGEVFAEDSDEAGEGGEGVGVGVEEAHVPGGEAAGGDLFLEEDGEIVVAGVAADAVIGLDDDAVVAFEELDEGIFFVEEHAGDGGAGVVGAGFGEEFGEGGGVKAHGGAAGVAELEHGPSWNMGLWSIGWGMGGDEGKWRARGFWELFIVGWWREVRASPEATGVLACGVVP